VQRLHAYILILALGITLMPLEQMFKFPILIEHFLEHKEKEPDISFLSYMVHHYSDETHTDDDHERDMQLPFKSCNKSHSHQDFNFSAKISIEPLELYYKEHTYLVYNKKYLPMPVIGSLFKPPRA